MAVADGSAMSLIRRLGKLVIVDNAVPLPPFIGMWHAKISQEQYLLKNVIKSEQGRLGGGRGGGVCTLPL